MKFVSVYVATSAVTGKQYVGITRRTVRARQNSHWRDAKTGSKTPFHRSIMKHGRQSFAVEHVASARTWLDACEVEKFLISEMKTLAPDGYNLSIGGQGEPDKFVKPEHRERSIAATRAFFADKEKSAAVREAMSIRQMGHPVSDETREKLSAACAKPENLAKRLAGRTPEVEARRAAAISSANRGQKKPPMTAQHKQKLSAAAKGRKFTPEHCAKIAAAVRGKKRSPEECARISAMNTGRRMSEEAKAKISAAMTGRSLSEETKHRILKAKREMSRLLEVLGGENGRA